MNSQYLPRAMSLAHCTVFSNVSCSLCGCCRKLYKEPFTAYSTNNKNYTILHITFGNVLRQSHTSSSIVNLIRHILFILVRLNFRMEIPSHKNSVWNKLMPKTVICHSYNTSEPSWSYTECYQQATIPALQMAPDMHTCHNAVVGLLCNCTIKLYNIAVTQMTEYFSLTKYSTNHVNFPLRTQ